MQFFFLFFLLPRSFILFYFFFLCFHLHFHTQFQVPIYPSNTVLRTYDPFSFNRWTQPGDPGLKSTLHLADNGPAGIGLVDRGLVPWLQTPRSGTCVQLLNLSLVICISDSSGSRAFASLQSYASMSPPSRRLPLTVAVERLERGEHKLPACISHLGQGFVVREPRRCERESGFDDVDILSGRSFEIEIIIIIIIITKGVTSVVEICTQRTGHSRLRNWRIRHFTISSEKSHHTITDHRSQNSQHIAQLYERFWLICLSSSSSISQSGPACESILVLPVRHRAW